MAEHKRGTVRKVTFEIEYPDGSSKVSELDDPGNVGLIAFDEQHVRDGDLELYNVSESDWEQNPAMVVYKKSDPKGIPFCTHNGCKK